MMVFAFKRWVHAIVAVLFIGSGLVRAQEHGILREVFSGIGGGSVADLTNSPAFPNNPTTTNIVLTGFEAPSEVEDNYGQRMRGYISPPVSGKYTFWIASDDGSSLYLSTDSDPVNCRLISWVGAWTSSREWTKEANQQSVPITLVAGDNYYIEALQKEGGGGDNLAVRWLRPDGVDEGPIPNSYLLPFGTSFTPPQIVENPTNTTVVEGQNASFTVKVKNLDSLAYQWRRGGVVISGAKSRTYTFGPVTLDDNNAVFSVSMTNRLGAANSTTAKLTVTPDVTPPMLLSGVNLGASGLELVFSEAISATSLAKLSNFQISAGVTVTAAAFGADTKTVVLTTTPMTFGSTYTITVAGLEDRARTPNTMSTAGSLTLLILEFVSQTIGTAATGSIERIGTGAYNVAGAGGDIGGGTDQFQFAWEKRTNNFDLQVRVDRVAMTDPFVQAGLMARAGLEANAAFAGVFGASPQVGSFFESRASLGANAMTAAPAGRFPVNYPQTWLRLRRVGSAFTGFGSLDGKTWVQLGTASITTPTVVYVGLAVTSGKQEKTALAELRNYGNTVSTLIGTYVPRGEPIGPSNRRTGLIFSEIMYHPKNPAGISNRLEYIEIYNADSIFEDLGGSTLSGGISYTFPPLFRLEAGEYVVIAAEPAAIRSVYGITNVVGPFVGKLDGAGDTIRFSDEQGAIKLEMTYSPNSPWPIAAHGTGHSLTLNRPSYGENDSRAWGLSARIGGSPGSQDVLLNTAPNTVVINEFLAHTDDPVFDFIELYNRSTTAVDLSGWFLTDTTRSNLFTIPNGTVLNGRAFISWDQNELGFRLSAAGERIYLISADGLQVLDALEFGGQENGIASGRSPDGSDTIRRLSTPTPKAANSAWKVETVVINELMYDPITGLEEDEYVELYNRGTESVNLAGWKLKKGIEFDFADETILPAGGYLVVAKDKARLLKNYPQLNTSNTVGDFSGKLNNSTDRLILTKPDDVISTNSFGEFETNTIHIAVADLVYWSDGRWGRYSAGGGSSLELIDSHSDGLRPSNWADSDETKKSTWSTVTVSGLLDHGMGGYNPDRLHILLQGNPGELLVDDVEVVTGITDVMNNGGFETGTGQAATSWVFNGNHSLSGADSTGAATGLRCLHVRGQGDGDPGINSIRATLKTGLNPGATATIRAKVRWLCGTREVLFKLRGGWLELAAKIPVPLNLGTPGMVNSRAVANAGPAVYDVTHSPALPAGNQAVVVTCRVSDPDGLTTINLRYRIEPATTLTTVTMRDDGSQGDSVAGDGVFSGTITARAAGTSVAFKILATDAAGITVSTTFPGTNLMPVGQPSSEAYIRWGDPIPWGNFAHYHLWHSQGSEALRANALNNTYRDATLVYGNSRVLYNVGFRDKGSPYHGGAGSFSVVNGKEEPLLGVTERIFRSTGNGGAESTGLRNQLSMWIGRQMGIPYLHSHYMQLFRNGGQQYSISQDEEFPNGDFMQSWFPSPEEGDHYKIAIWFEFNDDNSGFGGAGATLDEFKTTGGAYKLARYRYTWQTRGYQGTVNNYSNVFNLAKAVNDQSAGFVGNLLNQADIDEWMNVFAFNRLLGNWDAWTLGGSQNMYAYKLPGATWKLVPWDIDFTLGDGGGANDAIMQGDRLYDTPIFRRMSWRAYQNAVKRAMDPARYAEVIEARRSSLAKNNIGLAAPTQVSAYMVGRKAYIEGQITANDVAQFRITSNAGGNYTSSTANTTITGKAPFAVVSIEVNGIPYPATWTDQNSFSMVVPLTGPTNILTIAGVDGAGTTIAGTTKTITVRYSGTVQRVQDYVLINEIQYNPIAALGSFLELFNRSTTTAFDLSGCRLDGVGYTFPEGSLIQPGSYLILAKNAASFALAYGTTIPVHGEFPGSLDGNGESLKLIKPNGGLGSTTDLMISDVRFNDKLPWPTNAAGFGPSLQLIDPLRGTYRVANWAATPTNSSSLVTPGQVNGGVKQTLAVFPEVWINEVLPNNVTGPLDNAGEKEPFIELYNAGNGTIDLSALYLTDSYTDLTRWQFPIGTVIGAKQFLVIWADGQPEQTTNNSLHASFRLNATNTSVALTRRQGTPNAPAVLDYLDYKQVSPGRSFGSSPDGEPRNRRSFFTVTAGSTNNAAFPKIAITINEFMAGNTNTLINASTGKYDDWFELHNGGTNEVDLTSYSLTSALTNATQFTIPTGYVVQPGGFLLVWADKNNKANSPTNTDLHINFKLSKSGSQIGLFAPDGQLVDSVTFGEQISNVSMGRYPDGEEGPVVAFELPTPSNPNLLLGGNHPPTLAAIPPQTVDEQTVLSVAASATDTDPNQTLIYSLGVDAPAGVQINPETGLLTWSPTEAQGPGTYTFTLRAMDNGSPSRAASQRVTVTVREVNQPPTFSVINPPTVGEGTRLLLRLDATDPDFPANTMVYNLEPGAPLGLTLNPSTGEIEWTPTETQGPGDYPVTVRVSDQTASPLSSTTTFNIHVDEVNLAPTLLPISLQSVTEGDTLTFTARAFDNDLPAQLLEFSLSQGFPEGVTLDPITGVFRWQPKPEQVPSTSFITLHVVDNGVPRRSSSQTFTLIAVKPNRAPVLAVIPNQTVSEGVAMSLTASATDVDEQQSLTYSLEPGAPSGVVINGSTGQITWTPTENQGPFTHTLTIRVSDTGEPARSDIKSFKVIVTEINQPPVLNTLTNQVVTIGRTLYYQATASDVDYPANTLVYSLVGGTPNGLTIDPSSGLISWTPIAAQARTTNRVTVRVTDNGVAAMNDSKAFQIIVQPSSVWQRIVSTGTASSSSLYLYIDGPGDVYIDNLRIVEGTNPDVGPNLLPNGDFESLLSGPWVVSANLSNSILDSTTAQNGLTSLHMIASAAGTTRGSSIWQDITPVLTPGANYTLSYWYLPKTNSPNLTIRLSGSGITVTHSVAPAPNSAPVLATIPDQTLVEMAPFSLLCVAQDGDNPPQPLTFNLEPGAPTGLTIHPVTGLLTWTPTEAQSPSTNTITIRVTDNGDPALSGTRTLKLVLTEVNQPPILGAFAPQTVIVGTIANVTTVGTDLDLPSNLLTYSLDFGAPDFVLINAGNGTVTLAPDLTAVPSTYDVTVRVTDNGTPPLSETGILRVTIAPNGETALRLGISTFDVANQTVKLIWNSVSRKKYRVLSMLTVGGATNWTVVTEITAVSSSSNYDVSIQPETQQFYRIELLP